MSERGIIRTEELSDLLGLRFNGDRKLYVELLAREASRLDLALTLLRNAYIAAVTADSRGDETKEDET